VTSTRPAAGRRLAAAHKRELRERLQALAGRAGAHDPAALADGLVLLFELVLVLGSWGLSAEASDGMAAQPVPAEVSNIEALGNLFYTDYFYLFQAAGLILLVAIIGAITLTLRHKPDARRQRIAEQVHRRREDAVELRKVQPGSGI